MKKTLLVLLLAGLLATAAFADDYPEGDEEEEAPAASGDDAEKDVVVLTDANFDDILKKSKFALIEFYAPWCGHCKALVPHWAKSATILKESNPDVVIAKLDATAATESAGKFSIQGYPTIKWFVDGEFVADYNSGRDTEGIVKWVKKKAGPPATVVSSDADVANLEKDNTFFLLAYFKSAEGEAAKAYLSLAQKTEDVIFAYTTDAAVAAAHGVAEDSVVAIKNFEGEREAVKLTKELSAENLDEFVKSEKMPLSIEFNQENSGKIFNSGIKKQLLLWSTAADLAPDSALLKTYREVSKEFKGQLVFVTVNKEAEGSEPVTNYFGLKDAPAPSVVGFWMEKNKKYKLTGEITAESLKAFAAGVIDGSVQADFKSAAEPEEPLDEGVAIIVGKNVERIVKDPTKDVLLEIYAPWCGHCKKLEPVYKKLAKRFKSVESVVIAKMDGTENEHPDIEVKGFPTILFYPAGEDKTPITFEGGDRGLKALTKFIKEHAKVPYELPKKSAEATESEPEPASPEKDEL